MELKECLKNAWQVQDVAERLLKRTGMELGGCPENIDCSNLSLDDRFIYDQFSSALSSLDDFCNQMNYFSSPIVAEGTLHKNERGRYEIPQREFTSGNAIEYLAYDNSEERNEWRASRVEHNGNDYYIVGNHDLPLDGLRVRVR